MTKKIIFLFIFLTSYSASAMQCFGTEPFWTAEVTESKITIENLIQDVIKIEVTSQTGARGYSDQYIKVYSNNKGPVAVIKHTECAEMPSDDIYSHEAYIFTKWGTVHGCCGEVIGQSGPGEE